ncbi:MAG TPA: hypothetical protein VM840_09105 [Actinomycetota bacterium]|nr:hypothetical protein [Actinomycetota bacterium]
MKRLERSTYVVLGTVDLVTEKVREIPAVRNIRTTPVLEQLKDVEPALRRTTVELGERGEVVIVRLRARFADVRRSLEDVPVEARKAVRDLSTDARQAIVSLRERRKGSSTRAA